LCSLHLRVPDLGVSSPKTYHLGYIPWWAASKTPTASSSSAAAQRATRRCSATTAIAAAATSRANSSASRASRSSYSARHCCSAARALLSQHPPRPLALPHPPRAGALCSTRWSRHRRCGLVHKKPWIRVEKLTAEGCESLHVHLLMPVRHWGRSHCSYSARWASLRTPASCSARTATLVLVHPRRLPAHSRHGALSARCPLARTLSPPPWPARVRPLGLAAPH
jgi:hypothetical protein